MTTTNILVYKGTASAVLGAAGGPALEAWRGEPGNVPAGQRAFLHCARCNSAAREGRYTAELEQMVDVLTTEKAI